MPNYVHDTVTIKEARKELKRWGKFWQRYYEGLGRSGSLMAGFIQSQKSATKYHRRRRILKGDERYGKLQGVDAPYTADCSPTRIVAQSNNSEVFVPWSLQNINDLIESMAPECGSALRQKYIEEDHEGAKGIWLDRAERIVMHGL